MHSTPLLDHFPSGLAEAIRKLWNVMSDCSSTRTATTRLSAREWKGKHHKRSIRFIFEPLLVKCKLFYNVFIVHSPSFYSPSTRFLLILEQNMQQSRSTTTSEYLQNVCRSFASSWWHAGEFLRLITESTPWSGGAAGVSRKVCLLLLLFLCPHYAHLVFMIRPETR